MKAPLRGTLAAPGGPWWESWTTLGAVAAAIGLMLATIRFGADLYDEPLYLAVAYRFVLGDRPFLDELYFTQTLSVLLIPLVRLYYWLTGSLDGVVLWSRTCYVALTAGVGFIVTRSLRDLVGWPTAALAGTLCVVIVPHGVINFGHYSLSSLLFTLGIFLCAPWNEGGRSLGRLFAVGIVHGLGTLAHPGVAVASACFGVLVAWDRSAPAGLRRLSAYVAGAALVGALFAALTPLSFLPDAVRHAGLFGYTDSKGPRLVLAIGNRPHWVRNLALLAALLVLYRGRRIAAVRLGTALLFPVIAFLITREGAGYVLYLGTVGPLLLYLLEPQDAFLRKLLRFAALPGLALAGTFFLASQSASPSSGLLPAAIVTAAGLSYLAGSTALVANAAARAALRLLPAMAILFGMVAYDGVQFPKFDEPRERLTARVTTGPYRGLFTTEAKAALLHSLQKDLGIAANARGRIAFYPHFTPGYLMTPMRPACRTVWELPSREHRSAYIDDCLRGRTADDVVVLIDIQHGVQSMVDQRRAGEKRIEGELPRLASSELYSVFAGRPAP